MKTFIEEIEHQPKKPIAIERLENDVILIEGVRYDGDYFRVLGAPDDDVLYAINKLDKDCVLTMIHDADEARKFFEEIDPRHHPHPDPLPYGHDVPRGEGGRQWEE